jgi:DNA (cytosine-5)-methyltransferase 1
MIKLTAITFFAGAGGACAGLEQAGFEVIWGNEFYAPIADIWQLNHPEAILNRSDILELYYRDIPSSDLLWASPPCPEFSRAKKGRTGGTDKENTLIAQQLAVIIRLRKPPAVVIENVPDYAKSKSFKCLLLHLRAEGYSITWSVLNAADYGTPQTRQRLILVARLDGPAVLPSATHSRYQSNQLSLFGDRLLPWVGWHESIADLLPKLQPAKLSIPQMTELLKRRILLESQLIDGKANSYGSSVTIRAANEPAYTITANAGTRQVSRILLVQLTGYHNSRGPTLKLEHEPVFTITASMAHDGKCNKDGFPSFRSPATIFAGLQTLKVDPHCLARFQGFPDSHRWGPIKAVNCRAIGNAVAVPVARAIGLALLTNR